MVFLQIKSYESNHSTVPVQILWDIIRILSYEILRNPIFHLQNIAINTDFLFFLIVFYSSLYLFNCVALILCVYTKTRHVTAARCTNIQSFSPLTVLKHRCTKTMTT